MNIPTLFVSFMLPQSMLKSLHKKTVLLQLPSKTLTILLVNWSIFKFDGQYTQLIIIFLDLLLIMSIDTISMTSSTIININLVALGCSQWRWRATSRTTQQQLTKAKNWLLQRTTKRWTQSATVLGGTR